MLTGMDSPNGDFFFNFIFFLISEILILQKIPLGILILRLALYLETDL